MKSRIRTIGNKKCIVFSTEVDIEETVDVDIDIDLDECMDDIIDALTPDQSFEIAEKAGIGNSFQCTDNTIEFKRYLCDLVEIGYHSSNDKLITEIKSRL